MKLTASMIEAFSGVFLSPRYDSPQPTPDFHRECWARYCSDHPACATAAPRNHAKSTALTHDFILATVLFRADDYVLLVGSSEEMAIEHLGDICTELRENDALRQEFMIKDFVTEAKTDVIVECLDGHKFRIIARGAEQKIRGRKWNGKRPGLVVGDDLEDDEQVENRDRRRKFSRWFFRACKQALRDGGRIRVHGTILHDDSLLSHLVKNPGWDSKVYRAHAAFDDFSGILWPEKFPEKRLRLIRQEFIDEGDASGYSQEYLNDPFDFEGAYLRKDDFLPMEQVHIEANKLIAAAWDFASATNDRANRTSCIVGGKTVDNLLCYIDQRVGRWDSLRIIEEMFAVQKAHTPDVQFVEDGQIWKAISPMLYEEMRIRNVFIRFQPILPVKDKAVRGRALQKRMSARTCRFLKDASWYPGFEAELLKFTEGAEATLDDQFDSAALLARGLETWGPVEEEDFKSEEEEEFEWMAVNSRHNGRSSVTGY